MSRADLYEEMSSWSVGVALHRPTSSRTMYHSPLKLYEYAGLGLACLVSPSPDAARLQESGAAITVVEPTAGGIAAALPEVMRTGHVGQEVARARAASVLQSHGWTHRMESVVQRVEELAAPRLRAVRP
jgi:hypothetical protein